MTDTRRRVKVYTLNEDRQWDDRGTGHVSSGYVERLKGMSLLVRAESDGSLLLESKINTKTAYQKQQVQGKDQFCEIIRTLLMNLKRNAVDDMSSPGLEVAIIILLLISYRKIVFIKSLTAHAIENTEALEDVDIVQTFKGLKLRYDQNGERQTNPKLRHAGQQEKKVRIFFKTLNRGPALG
ncbi:hypothetical protein GDO86_015919 [Hymenochirus boettgeri]|uniref:PP4R3 EVH1-like domain-containing protein n=1 Tax=Hymenochirus boettgeri TaxID=247094 RepID=A0A8T2JZ70_9PIPI|nr:hypothetical protein GDO86_015919 [Hymenochirus boettgeri]